jgi:hypothetical protein
MSARDDDEAIIHGLLERHTARQLAEELVRRCGCTFDSRIPNGPPAEECEYHRQRREAARAELEGAPLQGREGATMTYDQTDTLIWRNRFHQSLLILTLPQVCDVRSVAVEHAIAVETPARFDGAVMTPTGRILREYENGRCVWSPPESDGAHG